MNNEEFKEQLKVINCVGVNCDDCPLDNNGGMCELTKFREIVRKRFDKKTCKYCGKSLEDD